jgi:hypothetical protein
MDGVLADMETELLRQATSLFGEHAIRRLQALQQRTSKLQTLADTVEEAPSEADEPKPDRPKSDAASDDTPPSTKFQLSLKQQRQLWRHIESIEGFWESFHEIEPGAVARLAALAADRRWELIFLTKRPRSAGATAQVQTQRWLQSKGFTLPSVYVVQGSRGRIAASLGLDFVIDDRPENCLDVVVDSRARAILVWRDDERLVPPATRRLGIGVVKTVGECLDVLTQIDSPPGERSSVMDKVMRLLGLKEPASV